MLGIVGRGNMQTNCIGKLCKAKGINVSPTWATACLFEKELATGKKQCRHAHECVCGLQYKGKGLKECWAQKIKEGTK